MQRLIGIRREDKNIWERRVPLIPEHVHLLSAEYNIKTRLQPFIDRAFQDKEYIKAGAEIDEDLSPCEIILAVKEIPPHLLLPEKTFCFFSHTIKGQSQNMPMLQRLLDLDCNLIDYECIKGPDNKRLVFFGRYAGLAGMIDTLHGVGQRLAALDIDSPFLTIKQAMEYQDLDEAFEDVHRLGQAIKKHGLPPTLTPFVIGIAGYGQVSKGAQEVLEQLPIVNVSPQDLFKLDPSVPFYKVIFSEQDMVEPIDPEFHFALRNYYVHPQYYRSKFDQYLDHLTVLVNAIYWDERYPRLVTKASLKQRYEKGAEQKLLLITDISCDIRGAIEITEKTTDPANPSFIYNPLTDQTRDGFGGTGIANIAIDNLPAELPRDSSQAFSSALWAMIPEILESDWKTPFEKCPLPPEIKNAIIVYDGELTPAFQYLKEYL